jgi:hypothetical protein
MLLESRAGMNHLHIILQQNRSNLEVTLRYALRSEVHKLTNFVWNKQ